MFFPQVHRLGPWVLFSLARKCCTHLLHRHIQSKTAIRGCGRFRKSWWSFRGFRSIRAFWDTVGRWMTGRNGRTDIGDVPCSNSRRRWRRFAALKRQLIFRVPLKAVFFVAMVLSGRKRAGTGVIAQTIDPLRLKGKPVIDEKEKQNNPGFFRNRAVAKRQWITDCLDCREATANHGCRTWIYVRST